MDAFCLQYLIAELKNLENCKINKISQPFSDELLFYLYHEGKQSKLVMSANPNLCRMYLTSSTFPNPLNSFNFLNLLRKYLTGAAIRKIWQLEFERVVFFEIESKNELCDKLKLYLIFEWMGRAANIILTDENKKILGSINQTSIEKAVGATYSEPEQEDKQIKGISKNTSRQLAENAIIKVQPCIMKRDNKLFDVAPFAYTFENFEVECFNSFNAALDAFYDQKAKEQRFLEKIKPLASVVKTNITKAKNKLSKIEERLSESQNSEQYRIFGELIANNIYRIKKGEKTVELDNYYDNTKIKIALDEKLSPSENAKHYFKKAAKLKTAKSLCAEQIEETKLHLQNLYAVEFSLQNCREFDEIEQIREELESLKLIKPQKTKKKQDIIYNFLKFEIDGFKIWAGKNNVQNAFLTSKLASTTDIWLHAQNVAGSHCVIFCNNQNPPEKVILAACEIAAYNSKNRNNTKVAVDYTLKKNVKNVPNSPLGFVTYTNNKTMIVEPKTSIFSHARCPQ